jgi:hypothetical protein
VPYAGDKRVFMAEQFYNENNAVRRPLHEAYIRKCLDNFKDNNGVIQLIGAEFTGPRHFVAFWLDVIKKWENENGKKEIIGLSTTKDVQDSILSDPLRAQVVDVIDIRQWHYQADGTVYAPKGGQNLAPRQHARLLKPKASSFAQVYRAVLEYRQKYPGKAVIYSGDGSDQFGWAAFMAGGSLAAIPKMDAAFLEAASAMLPVSSGDDNYLLEGKEGYILYGKGTMKIFTQPGSYRATWIDPLNGGIIDTGTLEGGKLELKVPVSGNAVLWLMRI